MQNDILCRSAKQSAKMARRVDVHKANLKMMRYDSLDHWLEDSQHVYVGRNVVYVAGARQHEFANGVYVTSYRR